MIKGETEAYRNRQSKAVWPQGKGSCRYGIQTIYPIQSCYLGYESHILINRYHLHIIYGNKSKFSNTVH